MNEHLVPPRVPTKFEDATTEDLYEVVGQSVFEGISGGPWNVAIINFAKWQGGAQLRTVVLSANNGATLEGSTSGIRKALSELCFRMAEAGHGWNVATYRLTSEGEMNIKFGLREEPWEMDLDQNYMD